MKKRHVKSAVAVLTVFALLLSSFSVFGASASDIGGHWAEDIIAKWIGAEKINGYPDGTFKPDNPVTRAEFVQILYNVLPDRTAAEETGHTFTDVSEGDWYYESVMALLQLGIVAEGETFEPESYITRQDAMTMIGRAFYVRGLDTAAVEGFADYGEISDYALDYVAGLVEQGLVGGYEDNTIRPLAQITRAESVKILDGLDLVHDKNSLEGIMERINDGVEEQIPMVANITITDENAEYYLGLKNLDGIEEALASEAMIGSIAHSVCLVRAAEGTDVEALKEEIRTSVNPRKWICVGVERDEVIVENRGNLILMVIDQTNPQAYLDSFMALDLSEEKPVLVPDENDLLYTDGYYLDYIGELRPQSVENFANKVESLVAQYMQNSTGIYYAIAPSKNYFVNDRVQTPFDYDQMLSILSENITSAQYINLFDTLTLEDYYKTDPHWRQERLQKTVNRLGESLGFMTDLSAYQANTVEGFIGQHGYNKENFPSEELVYLTNDAINNAVVDNMQEPDFKQVYNLDKLSSSSPYDVFLSGPTPLETITNNSAETDKELVIFRDSSTSSLAPLLIENYKTITLVDIRYMMSAMLGDYVNFDGKDVLFLYGEQVINFSEMLR
ncbi:MAG TPA: S-layer homology domain-containing protein [Candidatus Aphodoplasma excrementigallinarum]|uniref:S-layer homology domain-containing protein n=1 Tax=Candidatus Aphodoplasma excrementigallinarum TaxID=2840673 RepID=A0A9D1NH76_9FIRM|nr:S-layer homology domain-containing protein [Candidatus Aphodoplasma excrementigallinarum]